VSWSIQRPERHQEHIKKRKRGKGGGGILETKGRENVSDRFQGGVLHRSAKPIDYFLSSHLSQRPWSRRHMSHTRQPRHPICVTSCSPGRRAGRRKTGQEEGSSEALSKEDWNLRACIHLMRRVEPARPTAAHLSPVRTASKLFRPRPLSGRS